MLEKIRDSIVNFITSRTTVLTILFIVMAGVLIQRIFELQIDVYKRQVHGERERPLPHIGKRRPEGDHIPHLRKGNRRTDVYKRQGDRKAQRKGCLFSECGGESSGRTGDRSCGVPAGTGWKLEDMCDGTGRKKADF